MLLGAEKCLSACRSYDEGVSPFHLSAVIVRMEGVNALSEMTSLTVKLD